MWRWTGLPFPHEGPKDRFNHDGNTYWWIGTSQGIPAWRLCPTDESPQFVAQAWWKSEIRFTKIYFMLDKNILQPKYLVDSMRNRTNCPYVVSSHTRYTDFVNDYNRSASPTMTSIIRDPAERMRSDFYFNRYCNRLWSNPSFVVKWIFFYAGVNIIKENSWRLHISYQGPGVKERELRGNTENG